MIVFYVHLQVNTNLIDLLRERPSLQGFTTEIEEWNLDAEAHGQDDEYIEYYIDRSSPDLRTLFKLERKIGKAKIEFCGFIDETCYV